MSWLLFVLPLEVSGQKKRIYPKSNKPMITLQNLVSGIEVTFYSPAFTENPLRDSAWRWLTIRTRDDTLSVEAPVDEAYMINPNDQQIWSPDGKYMSLYRVYGIRSRDDFSGMEISFMALEYGELVDFLTKKRLSVTTDDFRGWLKNKPHTALKGTIVTGVYEEAEPVF